jgi:hypothetical protein
LNLVILVRISHCTQLHLKLVADRFETYFFDVALSKWPFERSKGVLQVTIRSEVLHTSFF